jgi:hypothetical protein
LLSDARRGSHNYRRLASEAGPGGDASGTAR